MYNLQDPQLKQTMLVETITWTAELGDRTGLATFDGVSQYINLHTYQDVYGNVYPAEMGGEYTMESWAYYRNYTSFARVFEAGAAQSNDIISVGGNGITDGMRFSIYSATSACTHWYTTADVFPMDTWAFITVTVNIIPGAEGYSASASNHSAYLSGVYAGSILG